MAKRSQIKSLTTAAHRGRRAMTYHGPGGIRVKALKAIKISTPKAGVKIAHHNGVKIPNSMHTMQPGLHHAAYHAHLNRIGLGGKPHLAQYHARIARIGRI